MHKHGPKPVLRDTCRENIYKIKINKISKHSKKTIKERGMAQAVKCLLWKNRTRVLVLRIYVVTNICYSSTGDADINRFLEFVGQLGQLTW